MTPAIEAIGRLAEFINASSLSEKSPLGEAIPTGMWANIVPSNFSQSPLRGFDREALAIYAPERQCVGLSLRPIEFAAPSNQIAAKLRLNHVSFIMGDRRLGPFAVIPILDMDVPLQAAVEAAGAQGIDLDAIPLLALPLPAVGFTLAEIRAARSALPILP